MKSLEQHYFVERSITQHQCTVVLKDASVGIVPSRQVVASMLWKQNLFESDTCWVNFGGRIWEDPGYSLRRCLEHVRVEILVTDKRSLLEKTYFWEHLPTNNNSRIEWASSFSAFLEVWAAWEWEMLLSLVLRTLGVWAGALPYGSRGACAGERYGLLRRGTSRIASFGRIQQS